MAPKTTLQGKKGKGCLIGCLTFLVVVGAFFGGLELFRRYVIVTRFDKDAFKKYELTPEITDIAEKITLTKEAEDVFNKLEPRFVTASDFAKFCKKTPGDVEALACHAPKPYGGPFAGKAIILLQIDDPRFADHKYSAAAHELLHEMYRWLSSDEKTSVVNLLNQEFTKRQDAHLQAVRDQMKAGGKEEADFIDELHSKFAVEYTDISSELEDYYRQYFNNRRAVVELYNKGGFGSRMRRMDDLNAQLSALQDKLVSSRATAEADQYNSLVAQYNAKVAEVNRIYAEIKEFHVLFNPDYKPPEEKQ